MRKRCKSKLQQWKLTLNEL